MRVLLLGDGCQLTTGFAQVLRKIATAYVARGDDVAQICSLDLPPFCDSRAYHDMGVTPFFPRHEDGVGWSILRPVVERFRPQLIVMNADPGSAWHWEQRIHLTCPDYPVLLYAPIEGGPVNRQYCETMMPGAKRATVTYTKWSSNAIAKHTKVGIPWVYHGVDTEAFKPLEAADRANVRDALGWTDSYVMTYVARNIWRKGQDKLIAALKQIRAKDPSVRLYLHCARFDNYQLQGWDLEFLAEAAGVEDAVEFPSSIDSATSGEPQMSLARKLAASDLYVHPAMVEGFGLPILEAMACGLPTLVADDEGNMREVGGDAPLDYLPPAEWLTHFNGARLASISPDTIAAAVLKAKAGPFLAKQAGQRGLARARLPMFRWEPMTDLLLKLGDELAANGMAVETPEEPEAELAGV